jgi:hypothetical protein
MIHYEAIRVDTSAATHTHTHTHTRTHTRTHTATHYAHTGANSPSLSGSALKTAAGISPYATSV